MVRLGNSIREILFRSFFKSDSDRQACFPIGLNGIVELALWKTAVRSLTYNIEFIMT